MNTNSKKNKGRRLQQEVVTKLLNKYKDLTERDIKSQPMGVSGEDIVLSEQASKKFPYSIECKNTERLKIWEALKQSEGNNRELTPALIFKRNRSKIYITLEFDEFLKLL